MDQYKGYGFDQARMHFAKAISKANIKEEDRPDQYHLLDGLAFLATGMDVIIRELIEIKDDLKRTKKT
jgi:hypothetical protein